MDSVTNTGSHADPSEAISGRTCAICQAGIEQTADLTACPACGTPYHRECWEYNRGCGIYGCVEAPPAEPLAAAEIPVSYWGKTEKTCPMCGRIIQAAAVRCRYCGATFASQRPESESEFQSRRDTESREPTLRRGIMWFFVFSVVSCTAPFAALFGTIWYMQNRTGIAALPGRHVAMAKIALAASIGQTALLILMAVLYGIVRG